jgi:hypothetical protein
MDSINVNFFAGFIKSKAKGTTGNADQSSPIATSSLTLSGSSTLTGANEIDNGLKNSRSLGAGLNETLDVFSFSNILGETAQSIAECRLFYIVHKSTSAASSITVGNAGANPFLLFGMGATTTFTFLPGEGIIAFAQSTTAIPVSAGARDLKVLNNDGANGADYEVGWFGSGS